MKVIGYTRVRSDKQDLQKQGHMYLPPQPTSFVGREKEVAAIIELLEDQHCRLLSLVGPGGIGKTRLAIEVGRRLADAVRDGVYFVSLESIPSADYVLSTLIERLGLDLSGQADKQQVLVGLLKAKQLVIVLDNFEHVREATPLLSQILSDTGEVKLLVTSREPLKLREEWVHRVEGLSFPQADTDSIDYGAMHLFAERARQVQAGFKLEDHRQSVARITRLTEGMPLALELAASWVHLLAPDEIAAELEDSLDLLETDISNIPDRHRSIRASFDLSMSQLDDEERVVLTNLSVFQGSFTFGAAKSIAGASLPVLKRLVDQSMLRAEPNGRYSMHEMLRQYASDYLAAADPLFARHSAYYLDLLATLEPDMKGEDHIAARQQIEGQIDNIRLAWDQAVAAGDIKRLGQAADSLAIYFNTKDYYGEEGVRTFYKAVEITEGPIKGRILLLAGWLSVLIRKHDDGLKSMLAGRALLKSKDDYVDSAMTLALLSWFEEAAELDFNELRQMYASGAAYAESMGRPWEQAWFFYGLGNTLKVLAEDENALDVLRQSEALFWACGDRLSTSWSVGSLAVLFGKMERWEEAAAAYRRDYALCDELDDFPGKMYSMKGLSDVAFAMADYATATRLYHETLVTAIEQNIPVEVNYPVAGLAKVLARQGQQDRAVVIFTALRQDPLWKSPLRQAELRDIEGWLDDLRDQMPALDYRQAVQRGEGQTVEDVARQLIDELSITMVDSPTILAQPLVDPLTERELDVLRLLAEGRSNRQIAEMLVIALGTVKSHVHNICTKLDASNRGEAVARARNLGILE